MNAEAILRTALEHDDLLCPERRAHFVGREVAQLGPRLRLPHLRLQLEQGEGSRVLPVAAGALADGGLDDPCRTHRGPRTGFCGNHEAGPFARGIAHRTLSSSGIRAEPLMPASTRPSPASKPAMTLTLWLTGSTAAPRRITVA